MGAPGGRTGQPAHGVTLRAGSCSAPRRAGDAATQKAPTAWAVGAFRVQGQEFEVIVPTTTKITTSTVRATEIHPRTMPALAMP